MPRSGHRSDADASAASSLMSSSTGTSKDIPSVFITLCMMYPRLRLLQKLLSNDGAIFISIDDNEFSRLRFNRSLSARDVQFDIGRISGFTGRGAVVASEILTGPGAYAIKRRIPTTSNSFRSRQPSARVASRPPFRPHAAVPFRFE